MGAEVECLRNLYLLKLKTPSYNATDKIPSPFKIVLFFTESLMSNANRIDVSKKSIT